MTRFIIVFLRSCSGRQRRERAMEYQMEELLPVVTRLAEKFTSKESSSVTYETAQMLMEGVIYCVEHCFEPTDATLLSKEVPAPEEAYRIGYDIVIDKVYRAKSIFDGLTVDFVDYGCRNYRDTITKGMPAFFRSYDPRFRPQNHILTLDYPSVRQYDKLCGIDLIYRYLCDIELEKRVLQCFDKMSVEQLLKKTEEYHGIVYMDNLCSLVLLHAAGCMISGTGGSGLGLAEKDIEEIKEFFQNDGVEQVEYKLAVYIGVVMKKAKLQQEAAYFREFIHDCAVRICNALPYDGLEGVFL